MKKKHPADGLYYVTLEMIIKYNPCEEAFDYFKRLFSLTDKKQKFVITLKVARRLQGTRLGRQAIYFLLDVMYMKNKITRRDYYDFFYYTSLNTNSLARGLMNTLHRRAVREKRVARTKLSSS